MRLGLAIVGAVMAVLWTSWLTRAFGMAGVWQHALNPHLIAASLLGWLAWAGIGYGWLGSSSPGQARTGAEEPTASHSGRDPQYTVRTARVPRHLLLRLGALTAAMLLLSTVAVAGKYLIYWRLAALAELSPAASQSSALGTFDRRRGESYALVMPDAELAVEPGGIDCRSGGGAVLSLFADRWSGDAWREAHRQSRSCGAVLDMPPAALVGAGRLLRSGDSLTFLAPAADGAGFARVGAGRARGDSLRVRPLEPVGREYLYLLQGRLAEP
jgi:hypothetical protein